MKKDILIAILVWLLSATVAHHSVTITVANPIPIPVLLMPLEFINGTISVDDTELVARVDGAYPFINIEYRIVEMYYPVPPNVANISVKIDEMQLSWVYSTDNYPTIMGDWPMIKWVISPVPDNFTISVHYAHSVPMMSRNWTFLYAMGTGKYLSTYAKQTTAYVNIRLEANCTDLEVYTIGLTNETWIWNPADYQTAEENGTQVIALTVVSDLFRPLTEDFLMTFMTDLPAPWDMNDDGKTDMEDIGLVAHAFGSFPGTPRWNPSADITGQAYLAPDETVDMRDIALTSRHFGETHP